MAAKVTERLNFTASKEERALFKKLVEKEQSLTHDQITARTVLFRMTRKRLDELDRMGV